jgi:hypothetical protein
MTPKSNQILWDEAKEATLAHIKEASYMDETEYALCFFVGYLGSAMNINSDSMIKEFTGAIESKNDQTL